MPQLSACPSCEEPLESGDLYCGACGFDLSAVPPRPDVSPNGSGGSDGSVRAAAAGGEASEWPVAPELDSTDTPVPTHLPTDLAGTDSAGGDLPERPDAAGAPGAVAPDTAGAPDAGEEPDAVAVPDEYPLPSPGTPAAAPAPAADKPAD
ncbi:serine/threonine-protein phosphatase, partial [Streptomyces sp. NPDC004732]